MKLPSLTPIVHWLTGEPFPPRSQGGCERGRFSTQRGEAGGGDGLAVAFVFFIRRAEGNARGEFGEFGLQNFARSERLWLPTAER